MRAPLNECNSASSTAANSGNPLSVYHQICLFGFEQISLSPFNEGPGILNLIELSDV